MSDVFVKYFLFRLPSIGIGSTQMIFIMLKIQKKDADTTEWEEDLPILITIKIVSHFCIRFIVKNNN